MDVVAASSEESATQGTYVAVDEQDQADRAQTLKREHTFQLLKSESALEGENNPPSYYSKIASPNFQAQQCDTASE